MTFDLSQLKPIPGFDSLKWKRERQAQILKETENMTDEEIRERFRKASEWWDEERAKRRREQAAMSEPQS